MKKTLIAALAFVVLMMTGTASALTTVDLIADGGDALTYVDVGKVEVEIDGPNLVVTFTLEDPLLTDPDLVDWKFVETHLHVAAAPEEIPQTKKGNARPGQFDYDDGDAATSNTVHIYIIPLDILDDGDTITVAAHAAIEYVEIVGELDEIPLPVDELEEDVVHDPSAWGGTWNDGTGEVDTQLNDGRSWDSYFEAGTYEVQE